MKRKGRAGPLLLHNDNIAIVAAELDVASLNSAVQCSAAVEPCWYQTREEESKAGPPLPRMLLVMTCSSPRLSQKDTLDYVLPWCVWREQQNVAEISTGTKKKKPSHRPP